MRKQWLRNDTIEVGVTTEMGPRLTDFGFVDGQSVLAHTPDITLPAGRGREFRMVGGHRLWAAPEVPAITYMPDDTLPIIEEVDGGLRLTQPAPADTGIEKTVEVHLPASGPRLALTHHLTNRGTSELTVAPWAITMLPTGGTAIVPLGRPNQDQYQADRSIVLWPYTRLSDRLMGLHDTHIEIEARREDPIKVGTSLRRGWLAYIVDGLVFVKRTRHLDGSVYSDLGASGQVYCNADFCELETLGPLMPLAPSMRVAHREVWELYERARLPADTADLAAALDEGGNHELHNRHR